MAVWLLWLIISGIFIVAEVFTLTFYLLLAGLGALAASGMAALEFSTTIQIFTATLITIIGWFIVHKYKPQNLHPDSRSNPNLNMDIGTVVKLAAIAADGKISVMLRGARWDAVIEHDATPDITAQYIITKIDGSTLILTPKN